MSAVEPARILVVDDNRAIHEDFRKILLGAKLDENLQTLEASVFGAPAAARNAPAEYRLDSAYQGAEAMALVQLAHDDRKPYSVAFVDMRMPPGWDGLETI